MKSKKGQLTLGDAPTVVLIVGLVFLVMATIALIATSAGNAFASARAISVTNETVVATTTGTAVSNATECGFADFNVGLVYNATNSVLISSGNYTVGITGTIANTTSEFPTASGWLVSYTGSGGGTACDTTTSLTTEISNNTSIAGIILTISLVGIVLSILVGVFMTVRRKTI